MSIFKPFITSDVIVSPFKVNKSFTFTGNELTGSNVQIDRFDTWSTDHTLATIIYPALIQLKQTKQGIPSDFVDVGGSKTAPNFYNIGDINLN